MTPAPVVLVYIYALLHTISLLPQDIWIMGDASYPYNLYQKEANPVPPIPLSMLTTLKKKGSQFTTDHSHRHLLLDPSPLNGPISHSSTMAPHLELSTQIKPFFLHNRWVGLLHHHDQLQPYLGKDAQGTVLFSLAYKATHLKNGHEFSQGPCPRNTSSTCLRY